MPPRATLRVLCVNCNICINTLRRHRVLELDTRVVSVISLWISPLIVTDEDFICDACWHLAIETINAGLHSLDGSSSSRGHPQVCILCGRSLLNRQGDFVVRENPSDLQRAMLIAMEKRIEPRQINTSDRVCHPCWLSVKRSVLRINNNDGRPNPVATVDPQISPVDFEDDENQPAPQLDLSAPASPSDLELEHVPQTSSVEFEDSENQLAPEIGSAVPASSSYPELQPHDAESPPVEFDDHETRPAPDIETSTPASPSDNHDEVEVPGTLKLLNYRRAANTASHCIFSGCRNRDLHRVSDALRALTLADYNYYIPIHGRVCGEHLRSNNWEMLYDSENSLRLFTLEQVEHVFSFVDPRSQSAFLDFSSIQKIQEIDDQLFQWHLGMSKEHFNSLLNETPRILEAHRGLLGLGALLYKLRTGESDDRISTLFKVPRRTMERLMHNVREILLQDFVPRNLGLNHVRREELLARNLMIPNAIFNQNNINLILICDGTYIYINKSSNYMFQKDTYSLHKYRNLLKPFLLVTCDGYIVDCLGPYKATTSDADIMKSLFSNENSPLRQYLQENDILILDRGFRDSVSLLEACNYKVYMPESLLEGERQLTTQQANRSRSVTICRWVVEVVNGYFKRDYKIFRQDYFNKTVPHMMQNFSIAASLINRFGVRLRDRHDAPQIIDVIRARFHLHNTLSDVVDDLNMNRRTSTFESITADRNNLLRFPRLEYEELILFALGTYQLRQARSYYGEHVRFHGGYRIEVCREEIDVSAHGLRGSGNNSLIRGKIKSRHISRKIYYVYLLIENNVPGRDAITEYCCNCLVGRRTIGCCAHVMTVVWYLGWARFETDITAPAGFLDSVVVREDEE